MLYRCRSWVNFFLQSILETWGHVCEKGNCGFKWCEKKKRSRNAAQNWRQTRGAAWNDRWGSILFSQGVSTEFLHVCSFIHRPLCVCVCKLLELCIIISHHPLRYIELYLNFHSTCCLQIQRRRFWRSRLYTVRLWPIEQSSYRRSYIVWAIGTSQKALQAHRLSDGHNTQREFPFLLIEELKKWSIENIELQMIQNSPKLDPFYKIEKEKLNLLKELMFVPFNWFYIHGI